METRLSPIKVFIKISTIKNTFGRSRLHGLLSAVQTQIAHNKIHYKTIAKWLLYIHPSTNQRVIIGLCKQIAAEPLGTYACVFVGCASALAHRDEPLLIKGTAILWGLDLVMVKYTLGHISGAYINPSANIAFAVARRFPWKHVPSYILAQLIGATLACLNLRVLFHQQPDIKPALTRFSSGTTSLQAVAWEAIITFILCLTAAAVATDPRGYKNFFGVATGAAVTFNVFIAGQITGASMNPARSISPATVSGVHKDLWVYIVGPTLGATIATLTYSILRVPEPEKSTESIKFIYNDLYTEPSSETTQLERVKKFLNVA